MREYLRAHRRSDSLSIGVCAVPFPPPSCFAKNVYPIMSGFMLCGYVFGSRHALFFSPRDSRRTMRVTGTMEDLNFQK
jgi:hypothetical protein